MKYLKGFKNRLKGLKSTVVSERPALMKLQAKPAGFSIKVLKGFLQSPQNSVFENRDS
jgi:hypothetical protein